MSQKMSTKHRLRKMLSIVSYYSGYCSLSASLKINRGAYILCFHKITETPASPYDVSLSDFSQQMRFLAENYTIVSVNQLIELLQGEQAISTRLVAISIDDGYADFYTHAFPILRDLSIPATIFLPVSFIDDSSKLTNRLSRRGFLTWEEIREMHQSGIEVGSHTVSHPALTTFSRDQIQFELGHSKARLEAETGVAIHGFAYPYGTFRHISQEIGKLIASEGFSWAVTSISGANRKGTDRYALRRIVIERDDGLMGLKRALSGALDGWIIAQRLGYRMSQINGSRRYANLNGDQP